MRETPISEKVLELDPHKYLVKPAATDPVKLEAKKRQIFHMFQTIGTQLARLKALPLQEEPAGSGNFVPSGNFSIREEGGGFFITGSGVNKERPTHKDILYIERVDYETGEIFTAGLVPHSRETLIHDLIFRTFPGARAVVHTHDKVALLYDRSPTTDKPIFFANVREAQEVVDLLKQSSYVHLRDHGQFLHAGSVDEAIGLSIQHHRSATRRLVFNRIRQIARPLAFAAGLALTFGTGWYEWDKKFSDCEVRENNNGTQSYICPTARNCGPIKEWEGEREGLQSDGQYECRYSVIPGTP